MSGTKPRDYDKTVSHPSAQPIISLPTYPTESSTPTTAQSPANSVSKNKVSTKVVLIAIISVFLVVLSVWLTTTILKRNESDAWVRAKNGNSLHSYQAYLEAYPSGKFVEEARRGRQDLIKKEDEAWNHAKKSDNEGGYQAYLTAYPNGRFTEEARNAQQSIANEKEAWDQARSGDSKESYLAYLNVYSNGRFAYEARGHFDELLAWERAEEGDSTQSYQAYLNAYPNGRFAYEARGHFDELLAWERAEGGDSTQSYQAYLDNYSNGRFADEARRRREEIRRRPRQYRVNVYNYEETSIEVRSGDYVQINASGSISLGESAGLSYPDGNNFRWGNNYNDNAKHGALLARITGGGWLVVGSSYSFTSSRSGYLQLLVNDRGASDNRGYYYVLVTIRSQ